ncbi:flagellar biosynthetic protein FliQ [Brevinema andersonii]|uniref:Flagellar biosynthetic protein FliQ n=1 Tax=Brevinema andersonii TaxID=34097 RepID=A0A1I1E438_BREAD|nr:flagellar biosynthetic protein FliQ [Brevinema andersonii]SFB81426.1 flagellar biosynthetic protein FliQ [Brevinema andersonii]
MSQGLILSIINQTMLELLFLSVPILGITMLLGLIISIFQATTSLQEQTLTFVPKFIIVSLLLTFAAPFYMTRMLNFTNTIFSLIATASL